MRAKIRFGCGCEIYPYVDIDDEMVHEFDIDGMICEKHTRMAISDCKNGITETENLGPFGPLKRRIDGTHP